MNTPSGSSVTSSIGGVAMTPSATSAMSSISGAATATANVNFSSVSTIVAEYLKSPDDLSKVPALRKKLLKEQSTLSAKLKAGAKDQLEATRDGLLKLQATRKDVAAIREAFAQVEALYTNEDVDVPGQGRSRQTANKSFKIISQVSQIHRNFVQTSATIAKLESLPASIHKLSAMLQRSQQDIMGPAPDLLPLHFYLSQLETFRNETFQMARTCSSDVRNTVAELFAPLDHLVKSFEEYIFELGERTLDLAREGQLSVVVKLVKIIEKESREDERAAAIRLAKRANLEGAARFRSVTANARVIKLYRPKLFEAIDSSTGQLFQECWNRFGADGASLEFLGHLDWIYKDLEVVKQQVVPLFPADYNIYRAFVKSYHKHLGAILRENILATDPLANALLELYQFTQEYTKTLTKQMEVEKAWLQPTLLAGKEQTIIDDYLSLITKKIDEWTANLMSDEVREFVSRESPPDEDNEGLYGLQGATILFQMINQQIDVAADSGQGSVLSKVVDHAAKAMHSTQATWLRVLESEFKKQREAKSPDDVTGGLVEYVIALANDQLKSADYAEVLIARLETMVSNKYKAGIREAVDNALNRFLDVSKRCTQVLVDLVFADLKLTLKDLFAFPAWYAEGTMTTIVETIRDYTADYSERLNPNLFDVLCDDLMDRLLLSYIGALRRVGNGKLKMPAAAERMKTDLEDAVSMFSSFRKEEEVREKFQVLEMIIAIVTSSSTMIFLPYWTFAKTYGAHLSFFEAVIKARDDLKKEDVNAIMESAKRKVKQEGVPDLMPCSTSSAHTIMSRVAQIHGSSFGSSLLGAAVAAAGITASASQVLGLSSSTIPAVTTATSTTTTTTSSATYSYSSTSIGGGGGGGSSLEKGPGWSSFASNYIPSGWKKEG